MRKILVSGCLYGWHCRYDAVDCPCEDPMFTKWRQEGRLVVVCPEVEGGLPTPRSDSQRQGTTLDSRVVACTGKDCTKEYYAGARVALRLATEYDVALCVLKEDSPSCGTHFIYDGTFTDTKIGGQGMAAQTLREAGFKVFSENELSEAQELLEKLESL